ncbi:hypothetical protein K501DRAFT_279211 [Backusella circina FSU 941]|nr:hypothetical protein K501DRAFT_279211 [Backusella circina FSU 941]
MQSIPGYYHQGFTPSYSTTTSSAINSSAPPDLSAIENHLAQTLDTSKRKQVKNACTNCQKACKKCDDARPCPRCVKYGVEDSCISSVRKERKKGIKRGPYKKRKNFAVRNGLDDKEISSANTTTSISTPNNTVDDKNDGSRSSNNYQNAQCQSRTQQQQSGNVATFTYPPNLNHYGQAYDAYAAYYMHYLVPGNQQYSHLAPQQQQELGSILGQNSFYPRPFNQTKTDTKPAPPVPSTSNSSGTSSPTNSNEDDETNAKFARLTELCSAALGHQEKVKSEHEHQ